MVSMRLRVAGLTEDNWYQVSCSHRTLHREAEFPKSTTEQASICASSGTKAWATSSWFFFFFMLSGIYQAFAFLEFSLDSNKITTNIGSGCSQAWLYLWHSGFATAGGGTPCWITLCGMSELTNRDSNRVKRLREIQRRWRQQGMMHTVSQPPRKWHNYRKWAVDTRSCVGTKSFQPMCVRSHALP